MKILNNKKKITITTVNIYEKIPELFLTSESLLGWLFCFTVYQPFLDHLMPN